VKEAAMAPIREMPHESLIAMKDTMEIRPIKVADFEKVLKDNQPSVSKHTIEEFDDWKKRNGK
jgi:SpoVK/Ycf46/Vps4 family AAA+-type ATPase